MLEIISIKDSTLWDNVVKSFSTYDVYYLSGYVKPFQIHGDGDPYLLYYKESSLRGISVVMKRDIAMEECFRGILPLGKYFDITTPYGYGGFLFEGDTSASNLAKFNAIYIDTLSAEGIVSSFVRFHPLLQNSKLLKSVYNIIDLGKTVHMDITSLETISQNMKSKDRNTIRRSSKSGVEILHSNDLKLFKEFKKIYNATMQNDNADSYYYFGDGFYKSLNRELISNYQMFYAVFQDEIIAMSIIIYANKQMHYHLSGSKFEYRRLNPTNLLLYEAAKWGCSKGFVNFHLGGGVGSSEDNLFRFKKCFNRNSLNQYSIGQKIILEAVYKELVALRRVEDEQFDINSLYFPLYRA